jgi:hypothetical protein
MIPTHVMIHSLIELLSEAYLGPPDPSSTWFIDNEPNSGILGIVEMVTAEEASKSIYSNDAPGSTVAANVEHLRWSLAMANGALRGKPYGGKWEESWALVRVDEAAWDGLRGALRAEFEALCTGLEQQEDLPGDYLKGVLGLLPHAAYHLGTIRQMVERVRLGK